MKRAPRKLPARQKAGLPESFDHAFRGLIFALREERNFRIHVFTAIGFLVITFFLGVSLNTLLILLVVMGVVLSAELFNTAFERTLDRLAPEKDRRTREIKNLLAAGVLVPVLAALLVGFLVLGAHLPAESGRTVRVIAESPWYLTVAGLLLTIALVIALKIKMRARSLFRGGMPSGHAAFSFAMLTAVFYVTASPLAAVMVFPLAVLVAQSRVRRKIHTWLEVVYGAILGAGMVTLVFQFVNLVGK